MIFEWRLVCYEILYNFQYFPQGDPLGASAGLETNYILHINNYQTKYLF